MKQTWGSEVNKAQAMGQIAKMNGINTAIVFFIITSLLSACVGLVMVVTIHLGDPHTKALLGSET